MEKMSDPFSSSIYPHCHCLKHLNLALLPPLSSTWSCKFLGSKGVSLPPLHPKQVPCSPATQITRCDQCHPEEQPGFMDWSLSLLLLLWAARHILQRLSRLFSGGHGKHSVRKSCLSPAAPGSERRSLSPGLTVTDDCRCCENLLLLTLPRCQGVTLMLLKQHRSAQICEN